MHLLDLSYWEQAAFWFLVMSIGGLVVGVASKQIILTIRRRDE